VVVLAQRAAVAGGLRAGARLGLVAADEDLAALAVPGRDAVAPPELAADAPVLDVAEPVAVGVDPVAGDEADLAISGFAAAGQFEAPPGEPVHAHEPLVGQPGLDDLAGAVAAWDLEAMRLRLDQQAGGLQVGQHRLARGVAVQAAVALGD